MPRRPQLAVVPFNYPTDRAYEDLRERDASRPAVWIQRAGHRLAPTKHFLAADERARALDPCRRVEGSCALGTRMFILILVPRAHDLKPRMTKVQKRK